MSNQVLFVSENKLKAFTVIHENVQPKELVPFIIQVQDIYLQEVIGTNFYDQLKTEVINSTVTSVNRNLLDEFIAPYLLNGAVYQGLPWFQYRMMNKGVIAGASEPVNSKPVDLNDIKYLRDQALHIFEFYRERLRKELILNIGSYPDYASYSTPQNLAPNMNARYSSGVTIPLYRSKTLNQNYRRDIDGNGGEGCDGCPPLNQII